MKTRGGTRWACGGFQSSRPRARSCTEFPDGARGIEAGDDRRQPGPRVADRDLRDARHRARGVDGVDAPPVAAVTIHPMLDGHERKAGAEGFTVRQKPAVLTTPANAERGRADRRGEMDGTGVVGEDCAGAAEGFRELKDGCPPRDI